MEAGSTMDRLRPMPRRVVTTSRLTADNGGDRIRRAALFAGFGRRVGDCFAGRVHSIANVCYREAVCVSERSLIGSVVFDFADFAENSFSLEPFPVESFRSDVMLAGPSNAPSRRNGCRDIVIPC